MTADADAVYERQLVQRAPHDADAFEQLYALFFRRVYGYVASRVGSPHDAEDVTAEIFLRVIKNLDQLRHQRQGSFAAWLFAIARHAVADHYRRNGRSEDVVPLAAIEPLSADLQADQTLVHENADLLYSLVLALPERQREVITLRYYGGLRNHEIAAVLGVGEKTVAAYISRALSELQAKYLESQRETKAVEDES
jgi:RNA polymerase sigma-70 factor (ECF subfamily)